MGGAARRRHAPIGPRPRELGSDWPCGQPSLSPGSAALRVFLGGSGGRGVDAECSLDPRVSAGGAGANGRQRPGRESGPGWGGGIRDGGAGGLSPALCSRAAVGRPPPGKPGMTGRRELFGGGGVKCRSLAVEGSLGRGCYRGAQNRR